MKTRTLRFEAVGLAELDGPIKAVFNAWRHEQNRAVGTDALACEGVRPIDEKRVHAAPAALVGHRGIVEPIAQHDSASIKRRGDHLVDYLGTRRFIDKKLAFIAHRLVGGIEHDGAKALPDRSAARLAQPDNLSPQRLEHFGKDRYMRGLSRPFASFEGDEHAAMHRVGRVLGVFPVLPLLLCRIA